MPKQHVATVREMRDDDLAALKEIYFQTRLQVFHWLSKDRINLGDFEPDTEGERIWLAELNDRVVGFLSVWEPDRFIHHLYVFPKYRGQGIGTRLLEHCLEIIPHPVQLKCVSANTAALRFYRSQGWKTVSLGIGPDGEYQVMEFG